MMPLFCYLTSYVELFTAMVVLIFYSNLMFVRIVNSTGFAGSFLGEVGCYCGYMNVKSYINGLCITTGHRHMTGRNFRSP